MKAFFYYLVKYLLRYYNYIYFRKIEVIGYDKIPKEGGVLFSPNHQGAFLDPLLVGSLTPHKITSLTRSDVFGGPFQWFLDAFQMLPVYRIRNGYSNLKKNEDTFAQCYKLLSEGKFMLMFSEGGHHDEYYLQKLSKGSSRLIYQAQKQYPNKKMFLMPVGLNYGHHRQPRCTLHFIFGDPIEVSQLINEGEFSEAELINKLRLVLENRMKDCLWLPENSEEYFLKKEKINKHTTQLTFSKLKSKLEEDYKSLPGRKKRSKLVTFTALLLSLPTLVPLWITRKVVAQFEDLVFISSMKYAMGVFFFPLWWLGSGFAIYFFFGTAMMIGYWLFSLLCLFLRQRILLL